MEWLRKALLSIYKIKPLVVCYEYFIPEDLCVLQVASR